MKRLTCLTGNVEPGGILFEATSCFVGDKRRAEFNGPMDFKTALLGLPGMLVRTI